MRDRRRSGSRAVLMTFAAALATVGVAVAQQDPAPVAKTAPPKGKTSKKGGLLAPGGPRGKALRKDAADPFAKPVAVADNPVPAPGTFHYGFKLLAPDDNAGQITPLNASYYPSRLGTGAAVVMLVHEKDRSSKDFEDKILDFDGQAFAEGLQKQGYAVLSLDLRGHGGNPRRSLASKDWKMMVGDLQAAYTFLIDRHNRGELNLSRLGVVALGEGANLVATWANIQGAAVSSQARISDLGGIVLISPMVDAQSQGLRAQQAMTVLAPRIPLLVLAGERDTASAELVKAAKAAVIRPRTNKVELYPSSLHGFKLLRLEPNVTGTILKFFDETIKAKAEEWEPRYNMEPVAFTDVQIRLNTSRPDPAKPKPADELK
jgi:pimeloyl-ACP methyl ester carboxylesterase